MVGIVSSVGGIELDSGKVKPNEKKVLNSKKDLHSTGSCSTLEPLAFNP